MLEYLEPFNCVQAIVILLCKKISSDSFKNMITYWLFMYKSYVWPFNCIQTNELWLILKYYLQTMHLWIVYNI